MRILFGCGGRAKRGERVARTESCSRGRRRVG